VKREREKERALTATEHHAPDTPEPVNTHLCGRHLEPEGEARSGDGHRRTSNKGRGKLGGSDFPQACESIASDTPFSHFSNLSGSYFQQACPKTLKI
jgi:hypothetical protein